MADDSKLYEGMSVRDAEMARNNKFVMTCHTIEVCIISLAYILEFIKGARTLGYVILTLVLAAAGPVLEIITYKKDRCSNAIKHIVSFGFGIFYIFICMTTVNKLAFIYVVPVIAVIVVYNDFSYCLKTGLAAFAVNVAQVIYYLKTDVYTSSDTAEIEIQLLATLLIVIYVACCASICNKNSHMKMSEIERQGEEVERVLNETLAVSDRMSDDIAHVSQEMQNLSDTVIATKDAMGEVNSGSADTADAVQRQLAMTENIEQKRSEVESGANQIAVSIDEANQAIEVGSRNIGILVKQVDESVESGRRVTAELEELSNSITQMNAVIEIINNITSETSLLALNASIEAARAGEAGKGFAVVASEIQKMATETEEATKTIQDMVLGVSETISRVVNVTGSMVDMIEGQLTATASAEKSFKDIESSTMSMSLHSKNLQNCVNELADANREIIDSISTISAITEEVAAHAGNTFSISERNIETVQDVVDYTTRLQQLAEQLKR